MPLKRLFIIPICMALLLLPVWSTQAQQDEAIYTVQVGDTLTRISLKYNISVADLAAYNQLENPNLILAGQRLRIPGTIALENNAELEQSYTVQPGDTLFQIAAQFGVRTSRLAEANQIANINLIEVGQVLKIPPLEELAAAPPLPDPFTAVNVSQTQIEQGHTLAFSVTLSSPAQLSARFEDRPIPLSSNADGTAYWGLVGIHALSELGLYSLAFSAALPNGTSVGTAQDIAVINGPYGTEVIEVSGDREGLLDPAVIQAEVDRLRAIWSVATPTKQWNGPFWYPVEDIRITSAFGTRRSYGGGPINGFHGGTDFGGGSGIPIYAPAAGTVVLAEPLNVRGNAVLIDHGMGLYSGYWHQSEIAVNVGDVLSPGDLIGYIGDTGLVTGPHLHWEMRLGGIAVEPLQWVEESIP